MRCAAVELDKHPETPPVDRARAEMVSEELERAIGDERGRVARAGPADSIAADEPDLSAAELGQSCGPRPIDAMPGYRSLVDDGLGWRSQSGARCGS